MAVYQNLLTAVVLHASFRTVQQKGEQGEDKHPQHSSLTSYRDLHTQITFKKSATEIYTKQESKLHLVFIEL